MQIMLYSSEVADPKSGGDKLSYWKRQLGVLLLGFLIVVMSLLASAGPTAGSTNIHGPSDVASPACCSFVVGPNDGGG
jgi:hypothetical protein